MDKRYESAWEDIRLDMAESLYKGAVQGSDKHYALAWVKLLNGADRFSMDELDLDIIAQFMNEMNDSIHIYVELWFNVDNTYASTLKVTVTREILGDYTAITPVEDGTAEAATATVIVGKTIPADIYYEKVDYGNDDIHYDLTTDVTFVSGKTYYIRTEEEVLAVMYDGSESTDRDKFSGKVYVTTPIFNIGNVVLEDVSAAISSVYGYFGASFLNSVSQSVRSLFGIEDNANNAAETPAEVRNAALQSLNAAQSRSTYLQFVLEENVFSLNAFKSTLISIVYLLTGSDITESIAQLDFGASVEVNYGDTSGNDIHTGLEATIRFANNQGQEIVGDEDETKISLGVRGFNISLTNDITIPETADGKDYVSVKEFSEVGVSWGGYTTIKLTDLAKTVFNFDYAVDIFTNYWFEGREFDLGFQAAVPENEELDQAVYMEIKGIIVIVK